MKALVIYHANCTDGFGAALAAWNFYHEDAEYVPANYGDCVISNGSIQIKDQTYPIAGRRVVVLDFSLPVSEMTLLLQQSEFVTWLDHHKSAILDWLGQSYDLSRYASDDFFGRPCKIILDNAHSGAYLAWEHYHLTVPKLILHVEDRDIWKWEMPGTAEISEALSILPHSFEEWNEMIDDRKGVEELEVQGATLLMAKKDRIDRAVKRDLRRVVLFTGRYNNTEAHEGLAANVVNDISEIGNAIANKSGTYSLTFFVQGDEVICSLRSIGDYDVSVIAKAYGGGGHKNASGFKMPVLQFFDKVWS